MHSFVFSALANFLVLLALWSGVEASHTHVLNMSSTYCCGVFGRFAQAKDPRQIQISLPDPQHMLHPQAHQRDSHPAAESGEDGLPAGFDQLDDIGVQSDGSHCHDDEELAQFF